MLVLETISVTERAALGLEEERRKFEIGPNESFALVWMSSYVSADGTPVPGFEPGYTGYVCRPAISEQESPPWVLAKLEDGSTFHFMPRFELRTGEHYVLDKPGMTFSIQSVGNGAK